MKHLLVLRILLGAVALGAAYVFLGNAGFNPDRIFVWLRAASQIVIVLSFVFLMVYAPRMLPAQRDTVEKALAVVVGFFIAAHSLPLLWRIARGTLGVVVSASGMSPAMLGLHHLVNMVLVPGLLWLALSSVVCRVCEPGRRVNEAAYWGVIVLAVAGLAYISLTPTWTIA